MSRSCRLYGRKYTTMQIKYNAKALKHISSTIDYYLEHFGVQAATNLAKNIDAKVKDLEKYPESGFPEPLLRHKSNFYRAAIVDKHHKLIYYTKGDVLRIAALWDTRMHPDNLAKRL